MEKCPIVRYSDIKAFAAPSICSDDDGQINVETDDFIRPGDCGWRIIVDEWVSTFYTLGFCHTP